MAIRAADDSQIQAFRSFSRFYTRQIGTLNEGLLETRYSLTEARILYEVASKPNITATELGELLRLDQGYLSRVLSRLHESRLIARKTLSADARQTGLTLTQRGLAAFRTLNERSNDQVREILRRLSPAKRTELLRAMRTIETTLTDGDAAPRAYTLRPHRSGDMGWVIHRHGVLYREEYGWDERFEALVARIVADFIDNLNPARERCWIAEGNTEPLGCVFLVKHAEDPEIARLRLLLVEPSARGLGLGQALVSQCSHFARQAGYKKITLWTNSVLSPARRIYEREGYRLIEESPHRSFGKDMVGQTWQLDLANNNLAASE
jgi:DNA-binding MarR family transcriptional regulator/GNAT superfamily N-acetyltransferase